MKRKLILINLALLAALAAIGLRVRDNWLQARARERAVLQQKVNPIPPPPVSPVPPVEPVSAAAYLNIAEHMLFAPDRNPNVVIETPKPKPMPELPSTHGVMDLGDGPMAILSASGEPHRAFRPGEQVGDFKLLSVNSEEIVFEWDGKEVRRKLEELRNRKGVQQAQAAAPVATPAARQAAPAVAATVSSPSSPFGRDAGGGYRACAPGDTSPAGTIIDGLRKVMATTPFGRTCHWEPVK